VRPSKLLLSKVTALRGGEVAFKDFKTVEKADIILCGAYAANLLLTPKIFVEMNYGKGTASDVAIAQSKYCGGGVAAISLFKYLVASSGVDSKKSSKLSAGLWTMFGLVTASVFKTGLKPMMLFNGGLQAVMTAGYLNLLK